MLGKPQFKSVVPFQSYKVKSMFSSKMEVKLKNGQKEYYSQTVLFFKTINSDIIFFLLNTSMAVDAIVF
jgi:hypothetical protein